MGFAPTRNARLSTAHARNRLKSYKTARSAVLAAEAVIGSAVLKQRTNRVKWRTFGGPQPAQDHPPARRWRVLRPQAAGSRDQGTGRLGREARPPRQSSLLESGRESGRYRKAYADIRSTTLSLRVQGSRGYPPNLGSDLPCPSVRPRLVAELSSDPPGTEFRIGGGFSPTPRRSDILRRGLPLSQVDRYASDSGIASISPVAIVRIGNAYSTYSFSRRES